MDVDIIFKIADNGVGISNERLNQIRSHLKANDIPETPVKEGYEFVAWVYGIDGMYTFAPTSNIASCYYLTARWTEVTETPKEEQSGSESGKQDAGCAGGCGGIVGSMGAMASALMFVGVYMIIKKKED